MAITMQIEVCFIQMFCKEKEKAVFEIVSKVYQRTPPQNFRV